MRRVRAFAIEKHNCSGTSPGSMAGVGKNKLRLMKALSKRFVERYIQLLEYFEESSPLPKCNIGADLPTFAIDATLLRN